MKGKKLKKIINKARMSARFDVERSSDFDFRGNQNSDVDDCLDLHGYTKREALSLIDDFISFAENNNFSKVRVITGVGEDGYSVLKGAISEYLSNNGYKFQQSSSLKGGEGAFDVWL